MTIKYQSFYSPIFFQFILWFLWHRWRRFMMIDFWGFFADFSMNDVICIKSLSDIHFSLCCRRSVLYNSRKNLMFIIMKNRNFNPFRHVIDFFQKHNNKISKHFYIHNINREKIVWKSNLLQIGKSHLLNFYLKWTQRLLRMNKSMKLTLVR